MCIVHSSFLHLERSNFPIYFRLLEQNLMTYARQMFFLMLLYDTELTVSNKAEIFLEIYGNTQLRLKSYEVRNSYFYIEKWTFKIMCEVCYRAKRDKKEAT